MLMSCLGDMFYDSVKYFCTFLLPCNHPYPPVNITLMSLSGNVGKLCKTTREFENKVLGEFSIDIGT